MRIATETEGGASRPLFLSGRVRVARGALLLALLPACFASAIGAAEPLRIATFNASLNRSSAGQLERDLASGADPQAVAIATAIRRLRPDVLLLNEFDHDPRGRSAALFHDLYLAARRGDIDAAPLRYRARFSAPVNTGEPTGLDLDRDGRSDGPGDAQGFGLFPGQYGMVVYSRHPIDHARVRSFQRLRWAELPGALLPPDWYSAEALAILRLSSKSHWDLPLRVARGRRIHLLASHPTPPAFDGPEDRNGRRNHDEIRLWADYLTPARSGWIIDDQGVRGGLAPAASFIIAGDLNADPHDGGSHPTAIGQLLDHPRVAATPAPRSEGAVAAALAQGGANREHKGPSAEDTADFGDAPPSPGNLRVDYVLPSRDLVVCASGVYWPATPDAADAAALAATDHRLVWVDVGFDAADCQRRSTPTGQ
jgi:endonuclease/exonuclease/phosphatase family metal-dependent hydrolase